MFFEDYDYYQELQNDWSDLAESERAFDPDAQDPDLI